MRTIDIRDLGKLIVLGSPLFLAGGLVGGVACAGLSYDAQSKASLIDELKQQNPELRGDSTPFKEKSTNYALIAFASAGIGLGLSCAALRAGDKLEKIAYKRELAEN
jgi:hypothetical protein